jgi:hypothetical protein
MHRAFIALGAQPRGTAVPLAALARFAKRFALVARRQKKPPSLLPRHTRSTTRLVSGDGPHQSNRGDLPPSLQPYYRAFVATTTQSAPVRRFGTFGLAVGAACTFPLASPVRLLRSASEPGRASRHLHAGCCSVGIGTPPELVLGGRSCSSPFRAWCFGNIDRLVAACGETVAFCCDTSMRRIKPPQRGCVGLGQIGPPQPLLL